MLLGVFDSGVGGLSVLRSLRIAIPAASFIYLADSGYAPYGERLDPFILQRSQCLAHHLIEHMACQGLVVACNTATAVAIEALRERWPHIPLVGIEPGIKPAVAHSRTGRIGVMATAATLRTSRFQTLIQTYAKLAHVFVQACPGLAIAIEQGNLSAPSVRNLLNQYCAALLEQQVDTVVLGCTHYAFVLEQIQEFLGPDVLVIDTAQAVAQHAARLMQPIVSGTLDACASIKPPEVRLQTTGQSAQLRVIVRNWLGIDWPTNEIELDHLVNIKK